MAGIEFKVDAVLGDTSQLQQQIQNLQTNLNLQIDNSQALQAINAVQQQVNALIQSMNNIPLNINNAAGGSGGGVFNIGNTVVQANQGLQMTQGTINNIQSIINNLNSKVDGTVSRIRLINDENGNIISGVATITNGYTSWTRNLQQVVDDQGNIVQGQLEIVNNGQTVVNNQREQNDLYNQARSLISQIGNVEKQQLGTHGQVQMAYQQQLDYLNQQLMALMQQDNFNDLLTQDQQQQLSDLAYKLQLERQVTAEKIAQIQQEADLRNFGVIQNQSINPVTAQSINDVNLMRSALESVGIVFDSNTKAISNYRTGVNSLGQSMAIIEAETKQIDANGNEVWSKQRYSINQVTGEVRVLDIGFREVTNTQRGFLQQLKDQAVHMVSQRIIMSIFNGISESISNCINYVKDLDTAMTNIRVVTMGTKEETKELLDTYNQMGQELGASTTDIAEGAVDWLRQGYNEADTTELVKDSTILSKLALIDNAEATEYLTSALKGYKLEAKDAIGVIDQLVSIDLEAATSAGDMAEAMSRTANMARTTGVEMNELLGMIATAAEVTQMSASTVGNSMKTVFSRMSNVKAGADVDEYGESLNDVEKVLNSVGIALRDNQGEWLDFYDVLGTVANRWDDFSGTQQSQITTALGGTRQRENILVMLENWDKVQQYAATGAGSAGTAMEKYGIVLESVEAKQAQLTAKVQEFYSSVLNSGLITGLLDFSKFLMDIVNIGDGVVGKILLMVTALTVLNAVMTKSSFSKFKTMLVEIGSAFKTVIMAIPRAIAGLRGQKVAQDALNASTASGNALAAMNPWLAIAELAILAVMGIKHAIDSHNQSMQESIDKANELTDAYKSSSEEIQNNIDSLDISGSGSYATLADEFADLCNGVDAYGNNLSLTSDEYERYKSICEQIIELNPDLMSGYKSETEAIGNKQSAIRRTIALLQKQQREEAQAYIDKSDTVLEGAYNQYKQDTKDTSVSEWSLKSFQNGKGHFQSRYEQDIQGRVSYQIGDNNDATDFQKKYADVFKLSQKTFQDLIDNYETYYQELTNAENKAWNLAQTYLQDNDTSNDAIANNYNQIVADIKQYKKAYNDFVWLQNNNRKTFDESKETFKQATSEIISSMVLAQGDYYNLGLNSQSFIEKYVKDNFELTPDATQETIDNTNKRVASIISQLNNNKEAQASLDELYSIDLDNTNYNDYIKQFNKVATQISQIIGEDVGSVKEALNFPIDTKSLDSAKEIITNHQGIGLSAQEVEKFVGKMSTAEVQALSEMDEATIKSCQNQTQLEFMIKNVAGSAEDMDGVFSGYVEELQSLQEQYEILAKAQDEYNQYGNITASTMNKLIDNGLLEYLTYENGQLQFNTQALQDNANSLQQNAIANLQSALFTDLNSIAQGTYQQAINSTDTSNANTELQAFQIQLGNTTNKALETATAISAMNAALGTDYKFSDEQKTQASAVVKNYNDMVAKVNALSTNLQTGSYRSSSGSKGGSGGSKESSSKKEWWETQLETLKDQLENNSITMDTYINGVTNILSKLKKGSDAWKEVNKELQEAKLDNIENQFKRGEITIDEYIKKLAELRKSYKKNTEGYKELTETINEAKADKLEDQYERGQISLAKYIEQLSKLRNEYKKNSEEWKKYQDLINQSRLDKYDDQYERGEISGANYRKYMASLRKMYEKGSEEYKDISAKITESFIEDLEKGIDKIDNKISQLGDVNTAKEQVKYAELLSDKYKKVKSSITSIQKQLKKNNLTAEQRVALQEELNELLEEEVDIRDEIEDSVREYFENQKEEAEQQAELNKKKTLYNAELEIYGKKGKDLWEHENDEKIHALEKELEAKEAIKEAQDRINEKEELENNLLEARLKLQNALNNKTTKILTKQDDGTWAYTFSANMADVKAAQEELDDAQKAMDDYIYEEDLQKIQDQIDELNKTAEEKSYQYEDIEFHADQEFEQTMNSIAQAFGDIDKLVENWMATYGKTEKSLISNFEKLTKSNSELTQSLTNLSVALEGKYETVGTNGTIKPKSFDTGGQVVGDGLIFAHDKERVLTQEQNANFTKLLKNISALNSLVDITKFSFGGGVPSHDINSKQQQTQTVINGVTCNFPNITTTDGLQKAILDLPRLAIQQSKVRRK